jgi:transposase-like protein
LVLCAQQLTEWRRAARSWRLALVSDDPAEFVEIELNEPATRREADVKIEIVIGKVVLRLEKDTAPTTTALFRQAHVALPPRARQTAPPKPTAPRKSTPKRRGRPRRSATPLRISP